MYDLLIIGAGPSGVTASIYASRYGIKHLVIGDPNGSSLSRAHLIENWPGEKSIKGADLLDKFTEHAKNLGGEFCSGSVVSVDKKGELFEVKTTDDVHESRAVIICSGTFEKKLNIPGEERLLGKGVSYCATCDGAFFKGKKVCVVGGGNSAVTSALMLSQHAEKVYLIHRSNQFKCETLTLEKARNNGKIEIIEDANVKEIVGEKKVEKVVLDSQYNGSDEIVLDGVFIEIGLVPNSVIYKNAGISTDERGSIIVDSSGKTSLDGVYAAGDVTNGSNGIRQILSAANEGMIAAYSAYNFLKK